MELENHIEYTIKGQLNQRN